MTRRGPDERTARRRPPRPAARGGGRDHDWLTMLSWRGFSDLWGEYLGPLLLVAAVVALAGVVLRAAPSRAASRSCTSWSSSSCWSGS